MTTKEACPMCNEMGEQLPELEDRLRACMNFNCRVNEFVVKE